MLIPVGVTCRISNSFVSYLYVGCSESIPLVKEERSIFLLSFTCNYVVSVRMGVSFSS